MMFWRMLSTPVLEAASISMTSMSVPLAILRHWGQVPQGSVEGASRVAQFSPLAMILAVVVLPVPRMPVSMKAWAILSDLKAFFRVRTIAS